MFDATALISFFVASAAIIIVPGPAQALVLARTLSEGRAAGLLTALGLNGGTIVHALAAGLGVSAILATSAAAFTAVKYAGAAYLVCLGVQAWRRGDRIEEPQSVPPRRALGRAVVTGILNPKVALFFLAFLPQFVDPARGPLLLQCLILGAILAAMDVVYESGLVFVAATMTEALRSSRFQRMQQRTTGTVLLGLGIRLALTRADR